MRLPTRLLRTKADAHKGEFGHILIVAGSGRFSGASLLCAEAALRSGAGLVTIALPKSLNVAIIKRKPNEVMTLPLPETNATTLHPKGFSVLKSFCEAIDVCVVGPGLTQDRKTTELIRRIVFEIHKPQVVDADGINALAGHLKELKRVTGTRRGEKLILTPHPGEMARLLGTSIAKVQKDRPQITQAFAQTYALTLVLKGHRTVVADHYGRCFINRTGNPGMATAGSGDVLAGIIAAFLGQGLESFDAAKFAVYIHGLAGDLAAKDKTQIAMIASDIIAKIPTAIKACSRKQKA